MAFWTSTAIRFTSGIRPAKQWDADEDSMEEIRQLMLDTLGSTGESTHLGLTRRIRHAEDSRSLWDLRGALMAALADSRGELAARQTMYELSQEFQGLLPASLATRPSPLA